MLTAEIQKLNNNEKLSLIEEIWQSIDGVIDTPAWHQEILQKRLADIKNNTIKFINIDDL